MSHYRTTPGAPPEFIPSTITPAPQQGGPKVIAFATLATVLGIIAGGVLAITYLPPETTPQAAALPATCGEAYQLAEEVLLQYREMEPLYTKALTDEQRQDAAALEAHTSQLLALNADLLDGMTSYFLAKNACEDELGYPLPAALPHPDALNA